MRSNTLHAPVKGEKVEHKDNLSAETLTGGTINGPKRNRFMQPRNINYDVNKLSQRKVT